MRNEKSIIQTAETTVLTNAYTDGQYGFNNNLISTGGKKSSAKSKATRMLFLSTFILIFFTACKDDTLVQTPFANPQSIVGATIDPANPNNPYDNYGFHHNAAIDYYLVNRTYFGSSFDSLKEDMSEVMSDYYEQTEMSGCYSIPGDALSSPLAKQLYDSLFNNCLLKYSKADIDLNVVGVIVNTAKQWETDLATFISNNPGAIPANDVKTLFITSSILRYSAVYWYNDYNKPEGSILKGEVFVNLDVPLDEDGVPVEPPEIKLFWGWVALAVAVVVDTVVYADNGSLKDAAGSSVAAAAVVALGGALNDDD